jgi:predicted metal-binding protein
MMFRCVTCKSILEQSRVVILNGTKDNQILFVCDSCIFKPQPQQTNPEKKEEVKRKIATMLEVIGGGK